MKTLLLITILLVCMAVLPLSKGLTAPLPSRVRSTRFSSSVPGSQHFPEGFCRREGNLFAKGNEFTILDDDDGDDGVQEETLEEDDNSEEDFMEYEEDPARKDDAVRASYEGKRFEYAAVSPNTATTLKIQVGDLALARKAWKKRRRSGSPLLVPCSVLQLDRPSLMRANLVYLLQKFGAEQKDGVVISLTDLKKRMKSHLRGLLEEHAEALEYEGPQKMIEGLFQGKAVQDTYGIRILLIPDENGQDELFLKTQLSKYRALQKAKQATLLQVTTEDHATDVMKHTGYIRVKRDPPAKRKPYNYPPLSAALRVSQKDDVDSGKIQQGSFHPAVLFDFDIQGDGGAPLLTLSLTPARRPHGNGKNNKPSWVSKTKKGSAPQKYHPMRNPRYILEELSVGEGPYDAKVVRLAKDHALVDFGVGRKFNTGSDHEVGSPDFVKVLGILRFQNALDPDDNVHDSTFIKNPAKANQNQKEEDGMFAELLQQVEQDIGADGEIIEDITHLFQQNEDGSLTYENPETGESETITMEDDDIDEDVEENDDDDENEDGPAIFSRTELSQQSSRPQHQRSLRLHVGDIVPVHVLSVRKQSGQFSVTTDPLLVEGKKPKELKQEKQVNKKLEKLSKQLGGLHVAYELCGREYDGTIQATSNAGDWLYVQPKDDGDDLKLPVGVATVPEELMAEYGEESLSFSRGDRVRIRLNGIDESRGQLAMQIVEKLSP